MVSTFAFNPMFLIHICAFIQTVFMAILIIFPERFSPEGKIKDRIFKIFKGIGLGTLIVFGIVFVDTSLLWLFGNWSMADWRFQLPSVIILLYLGLGYIIVPLFSRGRVLNIIFCGAAVTSIAIFLHWWVPIDAVMGARLEGGFPILVGVLIGTYVLVYLFIKANGQENGGGKTKPKNLWDLRQPLHYFFNKKTHFIFWILAVVQSMLAFYGYSILTLF